MTQRPQKPPRFSAFILGWLLADDWESPLGDFEEVYHQMARTDGVRAARRWYRFQVIELLPGRLLEKTVWGMFIFLSSIKIAVRSLRKHKSFAIINIGGLSVGIAACILIVLFIQDELSFDKHNVNSDRIVRIVEAQTTVDGAEEYYAYSIGPLGAKMVEELPGVVASVKMVSRWAIGRQTVSFGDTRFYENGYLFVDPSYFDLFEHEWISGSPIGALDGPNKAVLTESAVAKYFGDVDAYGKVFNIERDGDFTVTGVIKDPPSNSHLDVSILASLDTKLANEQWNAFIHNWDSAIFMTYLLLEEDADIATVSAGMQAILEANMSEEALTLRRPELQKLTDIHFGSGHIEFSEDRGRSQLSMIYMFGMIAFFIVLIACINYTNMATASSLQRAKEVGLRKAVGASRGQLARQFLSESIVTTSIAVLISLIIVRLALPFFNDLTGKELILAPGGALNLIGGLCLLILGIGFLAGSYPAFLLSRFDPAIVLKGAVSSKGGSGRIRQALVLIQFSVSIGLIISSLVVAKQLDFITTKNLGFNQDQLVIIDINDGNSRAQFQAMKDDLKSDPSVLGVSVSSNVPGDWKNITQIDIGAAESATDELISAHFLGVDEDFLATYEIDLIEGRNLSEASMADSLAVLLNQTAATQLNASIGSRVVIPGESLRRQYADTQFEATIVGIVKDFSFKSLHEQVGPMVLGFHSNPIDVIDYFAVRLDGRNIVRSMDHLRNVGEKFDPRHPFEFNFLDERLGDFYESETQMGILLNFATMLAILIACLGVFGLAAFTTVQRTKEIGVRKVLGASTSNLLLLLSKDVLILITVSFMIAAPITYIVMQQWLQAFAYQTEIGIGLFLITLVGSLVLAAVSISYQSIRASVKNPVDCLRYE